MFHHNDRNIVFFAYINSGVPGPARKMSVNYIGMPSIRSCPCIKIFYHINKEHLVDSK